MKPLQSLHYHEICQIDGSMTVQKLKALLNYKTKNKGLILEEKGVIVGYVIYEPEQSVIINHFFVDPIYRRMGFGSSIMGTMEELALMSETKCLFHTVDEYSVDAQLFLKAMGFTGKINKANRNLIDFTLCLEEMAVA
jgi:GNAT superfamily N-acetyltransferase